ncbi:uncharacterized protein LOC143190251 isoform X2 [Rhynchophorus ferrugineus]|uniref:uncharacterized protein LOC143190251 isoform X2 n=1 Tax=Rhynchophorus ferrugineus TaxID=354439 RepID=UPI003FCDD5C6
MSKTRAWEKERRNRLNEGFTKLSQVLPCYDSSKTFSKIEILERAKLAIKDLDEKLKNFLCPAEPDKGETEKIKADIIKKLQDRIKKLLVRNEQLSNLLKNAGITVPREYSAVKKFSRRYKDAYKLSEDQVKAVQKELEKENQISVLKPKKKACVNSKLKKNSSPCMKGKRNSKKEQISKFVSSANCVFIVSQPNLINNSCYIIAKNSKKGNQTVITNSVLLKPPIVSPNIKPSIITASSSTNLGTGTLILTNGTVMPVLPTPQMLPILPILNPIQNRVSTLIVVSCSSKTTCTTKNTISNVQLPETKEIKLSSDVIYSNIPPVIRPKTCFTKTTQVNKVPIPALSSKASHCCMNNTNTKAKVAKTNGNEIINVDKNGTNRNKRKQPDIKNTEKKVKHETELTKGGGDKSSPSSSLKNCEPVLVEISDVPNNKNERSSAVNSESKLQIGECKAVVSQSSDTITNQSIESTIPEMLHEPAISESETPTLINVTKQCDKVSVSKEQEALHTPIISGKNINCEPSLDKNNQKEQLVEATVRTTTNITTPDLNSIFNSSMSKTQYSISTIKSNLSINKYESQALHVTKDLNDPPELKQIEINLPQSELSNDLFASLQVPPGCQNTESTSPTAAFLLAFPLVSSGAKVTEVEGEENAESHAGTPNLLQIGTMDSTKATQSHAESLTPSLLNLDNFSFFSNKDSCGGFYNNYSMVSTAPSCNLVTTSTVTSQSSFVDNVSMSNEHAKRKTDKVIENSSCRNYGLPVTENVGSIDRKSTALNKKNNSIKYPSFNSGNLCSSITNSTDRHNSQIHSNSFQAKSLMNNFGGNKIKTDIMEPYNSKSFDNSSNYLSYKDCNSLAQNTFNSNRNFNPAYTIAGTNNYFYNSYGTDSDRSYNMSQCGNYTDYRKSDHFLNNYNEPQVNHSNVKVSGSQNKLINWMTTPNTTSSSSYKTDYFLPPFSKDNDFTTNLNTTNTFNTASANVHFSSASVYGSGDYLNHGQDLRKSSDITLPTYNNYQRPETEDNQFSWSPNKMPQFFDAAHSFVSSTLPTLVGDLALNNITTIDPKNTVKERNKENRRKMGGYENNSGQSNFLSVSQLMERETIPGKISSRRNSGNRSKNNPPKKRVSNKGESNKDMSVYHKSEKGIQPKNYGSNNVSGNLFCDSKQARNNKMIPSSYSAEALIGNQMSTDGGKKNLTGQNKPPASFLSDNIVPYFPTVDVPQDNSYIQTNQTYQTNTFSHNFTSFQNNTYGTNNIIPNACAIPTTYIPNNNFMHSSNGQDGFQMDNSNIFQNTNLSHKDKNIYTTKHYNRGSEKDEKNETISCKKAKKRTLTESNLSSFDIPFLSLPGPINSPILPDDFHTTYLPTSTLYSCKNPLYPKTTSELTPSSLIPPLPSVPPNRTSIQHPEISPSVNSVGTSLTNFNLSTIFPEINKGPVHEPFPEIRNKDYSPLRNFPVTSSIQVGTVYKQVYHFWIIWYIERPHFCIC